MTRAIVLLLIVVLASIAWAPAQSNTSNAGQASLGNNSNGKTTVMKPGTLVTTAVTADQVVLTYTVTIGKTLYLQMFESTARLTTYAATATYFGDCSLESPAGTKLHTMMITGTGQSLPLGHEMAEPIPIASATVVRIVCTPSATTSFTWRANLAGYER